MSRRKLSEENIRNIQKSKKSYYVTLPIELVRGLGWREQQKVVVYKKGEEIIIKDWEEKKK